MNLRKLGFLSGIAICLAILGMTVAVRAEPTVTNYTVNS